MNCKFCGREIWLAGFFGDRDFCIPSHRKKFNERLRNVIVQSEAAETKALRMAGPRFLASPADCPGSAAPNARLHAMKVAWAASFESLQSAVRVAAPNWQFEMQAEVTPVTPAVEDVAALTLEPVTLSVDAMPASPADSYENRLQRVLDLISKMRSAPGPRKARGLHAAA